MDLYKQMSVESTRNTKAIKKKMGTYAGHIYVWLICKLTVPQRTIASKANMQYIFKIICIVQSLYTCRKILKE